LLFEVYLVASLAICKIDNLDDCYRTDGWLQMNLRVLDLNLLVSLDVLLRERNVTRAARVIGLSQPALSAQLGHLRAMFDDPLLTPSPKGMTATPRALELAGPLAELLGEIEGFMGQRTVFDPARTTLTFRIVMPDAVQLVLGVPVAARLRQIAPHAKIAMRRVAPGRLDGLLQNGDLDLAIVTPSALQPHWHSRKILDERFVCMVRRDHPQCSDVLDIDLFCKLPHLLVSTTGGGFSGIVDEILESLGRRRDVMVSVEDFLIAMAMVEATDLIATMPARLARDAPATLRQLPPPLDIGGFALHAAWHARSNADPAHRWLRDEIAAVARTV
jgi:DNA-binding transcriptional LysR family regulator